MRLEVVVAPVVAGIAGLTALTIVLGFGRSRGLVTPAEACRW